MRLRSLKWLFILQAAVFAILVFGSWTRMIQLHYPRAIENEPLLAPVKVNSYSPSTLVLEDGRSFEVFWSTSAFSKMLTESEGLVDLHFYSSTEIEVYAKHRGWICGTPWIGLIEIPLIADDVPIYRRELIGFAKKLQSVDVARE